MGLEWGENCWSNLCEAPNSPVDCLSEKVAQAKVPSFTPTKKELLSTKSSFFCYPSRRLGMESTRSARCMEPRRSRAWHCAKRVRLDLSLKARYNKLIDNQEFVEKIATASCLSTSATRDII